MCNHEREWEKRKERKEKKWHQFPSFSDWWGCGVTFHKIRFVPSDHFLYKWIKEILRWFGSHALMEVWFVSLQDSVQRELHPVPMVMCSVHKQGTFWIRMNSRVSSNEWFPHISKRLIIPDSRTESPSSDPSHFDPISCPLNHWICEDSVICLPCFEKSQWVSSHMSVTIYYFTHIQTASSSLSSLWIPTSTQIPLPIEEMRSSPTETEAHLTLCTMHRMSIRCQIREEWLYLTVHVDACLLLPTTQSWESSDKYMSSTSTDSLSFTTSLSALFIMC